MSPPWPRRAPTATAVLCKLSCSALGRLVSTAPHTGSWSLSAAALACGSSYTDCLQANTCTCTCLFTAGGATWPFRPIDGCFPSCPPSAGGICIAQSLKVPAHSGPGQFDKIIRLLLDTRQARAVILFASQQDIRWVELLNRGGAKIGCHTTFCFLLKDQFDLSSIVFFCFGTLAYYSYI